MSILTKLHERKITLIMSLPENNLQLAEAAINAGADVIKVHINVEHRASKTKFGSFVEELSNLNKIIKLAQKHEKEIGIVAGGSNQIPMSEIESVMEAGYDFISLYDKHMNAEILDKEIVKMVAIDNSYDLELVKMFDLLPIDILECSIMNPETYGQPLTVKEILQYKSVRMVTNRPIVIPTQRKIEPKHIKILKDVGINGIMLGAVVTGKTAESIYKTVKSFRNEIDRSY